MSVDGFAQQAQALRRRVTDLYQRSVQEPTADLLARAFDELQHALDQLGTAEELLRTQAHEIAVARAAAEQEQVSTIDVFNGVPAPYLITGADGTIRRLNQAAADFLNQTEKFLLGKSLGLFIPEGERRAFRSSLERLRELDSTQEHVLRLQPTGARPLQARLTIRPSRDRAGRVVAFHWLISHTTRRGAIDDTQLSERFA